MSLHSRRRLGATAAACGALLSGLGSSAAAGGEIAGTVCRAVTVPVVIGDSTSVLELAAPGVSGRAAVGSAQYFLHPRTVAPPR